MDSGNLLANPLYQFVGLCLGHMPAHTFQHPVRDVLQGNIEIFADIGLLTHHLQQLPREMGGICIMEPNPFHAGDVGHALHQLCNMLLAINVNAIISQFLCYHLELLHAQ